MTSCSAFSSADRSFAGNSCVTSCSAASTKAGSSLAISSSSACTRCAASVWIRASSETAFPASDSTSASSRSSSGSSPARNSVSTGKSSSIGAVGQEGGGTGGSMRWSVRLARKLRRRRGGEPAISSGGASVFMKASRRGRNTEWRIHDPCRTLLVRAPTAARPPAGPQLR